MEVMQTDAMASTFAQELGAQALRAYLHSSTSRVLLIGGQEAGMELSERARVIYVDLPEMRGTDTTIREVASLPFSDANFDFIVACQSYGIDKKAFLELVRVLGNDGVVCIVAPCNPQIYRLARDIFSTYPDSGHMLEAVAQYAGEQVTLLESFVARGQEDGHDTLVAVFRKGKNSELLRGAGLHEAVEAQHIWTKETQAFRASGPGMRLTREMQEMSDLDCTINGESGLSSHEIHELKNRLSTLESTLRQREEEIAQAWRELDRVRAEAESARIAREKLQGEFAASEAWVFRLAGERQEATRELERVKKRAEQLDEQLKVQNATIARLTEELCGLRDLRRTLSENYAIATEDLKSAQGYVETVRAERDEAHTKLQKRIDELATLARLSVKSAQDLADAKSETDARFREIARVGELLDEAETARADVMEQRDWLAEVYSVLARRPWWWALMPRQWRRTREHALWREKALFDADGYARLYPDVASEGIDPLRHYISHGMREGRMLVR